MRNKDRKKIFVYGYRNVNLGDDLFFYTLFSRYKQVECVMCAPRKYKEIFSDFDNVRIYRENVFLLAVNRVFSTMFRGRNLRTWLSRSCDAGVLIMGSCLGENKQGKTSYYYEPSVRAVHNVFIIGVNVAEVYSKQHIEMVSQYLRQCRDVCFRDRRSKEMFGNLENVRMAPDVVFQLADQVRKVKTKKRVVFSVINMNTRSQLKKYALDYDRFIEKGVEFFGKRDYEIVFVSFCQEEGDGEYIKQVVSKDFCRERKITYYEYNGNIEETLLMLREAESIIATRFHSMILGWTYGKKVLPVVYNQKMQNVIEDYHYHGSYVKMEELKEFSQTDFAAWMAEEAFDATECAQESQKQFLGLDEFVYGRKESA